MVIINDLKILKKRIAEFENEISNDNFGKWLSDQCVRNNVTEFYEDLITDLMTELEGLQVEMIDTDKPEQKKYVHYSEDFINETVRKIDSEINKTVWINPDQYLMINERREQAIQMNNHDKEAAWNMNELAFYPETVDERGKA